MPQSDAFVFNVGPALFKVAPRSSAGIFKFLGTLVAAQRNHFQVSQSAYVPPGRVDATQLPLLSTAQDDQNLITVMQNGIGNCFAESQVYNVNYCVPVQAKTTKRIFALLEQLIAFQTEPKTSNNQQ
jgi:hypothetical protein